MGRDRVLYLLSQNNKRKITQKFLEKILKKFNLWINGLSKENLNDHSWWLTRLASRDERISSIFHNIVIYKTILKISNYKTNIICLLIQKN